VDGTSAESPVATVTIEATAHNCDPSLTEFTKTITETGKIDFSAFVSDHETTDPNLTIKLTSKPSKGVLTVGSSNAATNTAYAISAITYTSNASQCASPYLDSFNYKVIDAQNVETSVGTVNISATAFNCLPVSTTFTETITGTATIDFSTHVSDQETTAANLTIKLETLPAKAVLTVSGATAATGVAYPVNAIIYTSNVSECIASYSDSFTYKAVDESSAESPVGTVNISANAFNCAPVSTSFTKTITITGTIDFTTHVSDHETSAANLKIKLTTLPTKGHLATQGVNDALGTAYAVDAMKYTSNASECASAYSDSFNYMTVDENNTNSPESTVTIAASAFNCAPISETFTQTITRTATIDFITHVSDNETNAVDLTIKLKSLPAKGVLRIGSSNVENGTACAVDAMTYTSNASECASAYSDSFNYTVTDANSVESSASTVNISATAHNCAPVSTAFTMIVTEETATSMDFTAKVSDKETTAANLKIKLTSLPAEGMLTVGSADAEIDTAYAVASLKYTTLFFDCDKFNYKVVDPSGLESSVSTINIKSD